MQSQVEQPVVLELNDNVHSIGDVFRIRKGTNLWFYNGPTVKNLPVRLFISYPPEDDTEGIVDLVKDCKLTEDDSQAETLIEVNDSSLSEVHTKNSPEGATSITSSKDCGGGKAKITTTSFAHVDQILHPSLKVIPFESSFEHNTFYEVLLDVSDDSASLKPDFKEILLKKSGSFRYFFTLDGSNTWKNAAGSGFFIVDPEIRVGKDDCHSISVDGVMCQTVVTKCLGKFEEWLPRILVTKESGYNAIHFTPMQELGPYGSSYAIKDQMKVNPLFYPADGKEVTMEDIKSLITSLREDHGLMSVADLVLNHTACESQWIRENPQCVYNLHNSPYVRPAFIVDRAIHRLMLEVSEDIWSDRGIPSVISTEEHMRCLSSVLINEILPHLHIEQFYQAGVDEVVQEFKLHVQKMNDNPDLVKQASSNTQTMKENSPASINSFSNVNNSAGNTYLHTSRSSAPEVESYNLYTESAGEAVDKSHEPNYMLEEYADTANFYKYMPMGDNYNAHSSPLDDFSDLKLVYDEQFRRLKARVNLDVATRLCHFIRTSRSDSLPPHMLDLSHSCTRLRRAVTQLNESEGRRVMDDLRAAVQNFVSDLRNRIRESTAAKINVSDLVSHKISWIRYFVNIEELNPSQEAWDSQKNFVQSESLRQTGLCCDWPEEKDMYDPNKACYWMVHSGWMENQAPLVDFAGEEGGGRVYLRRELHSWNDSVKLRYGNSPADCPVLWDHMAQYVRQTAEIFQGVRLDNLHTTPLHVGEWMLNEARKVRPDIYVIAELITNSSLSRSIYTNHLGISAIIHNLYHCGSSKQLSDALCLASRPIGCFIDPDGPRMLLPCPTRYIYYDQTHDDPSPLSRNSAENSVAVAAAVSAAGSAVASNRGYDELVPYNISIIDEYRLFLPWSQDSILGGGESVKFLKLVLEQLLGTSTHICPLALPESYLVHRSVGSDSGMIRARQAFTRLHTWLCESGFSQTFCDEPSRDCLAVTRHHPVTHQFVVLLTHMSWGKPSRDLTTESFSMKFPGFTVDRVIFELRLISKEEQESASENRVDKTRYITGLSEYSVSLLENIEIGESGVCEVREMRGGEGAQLMINGFSAGSAVAIQLAPTRTVRESLDHMHGTLKSLGYMTGVQTDLSCYNTELLERFNALSAQDIYGVLFETEQEQEWCGEGGSGGGRYGVYSVPGLGDLPHYGLQGVLPLLREIYLTTNLDHPLCRNLREGDWMLDYIVYRLRHNDSTVSAAESLNKEFDKIKTLPRYLVPVYFNSYVMAVTQHLISLALQKELTQGERLLFESMAQFF